MWGAPARSACARSHHAVAHHELCERNGHGRVRIDGYGTGWRCTVAVRDRRQRHAQRRHQHWALPKVDLGAAGADIAPTIVAPTAPDPMTGSAILPLRYGDGAPFTTLARVRLRYVRQSWHGRVLHDSWRNPGHPEAVPTGPLGDEIFGAVLRAHRGDIIEIVLAADPGSGGESSVVVLSLDKV